MAIGPNGAIQRHLRTLFNVGTFGTLTDGQLLDRFAAGRDEAAEMAFAALVERHGPMVLRVCRSVLRDEHDAQDAFQATFLVLVRRSGSLWVGDSLGPWLHGVARRVASVARSAASRRRRHERKAAERVVPGGFAPEPGPERAGDLELEQALHEEIGRLPERYRAAVVHCLLEGLTHEQAARSLGWPVGTVKSRLAQGRERLRLRLIRRGLAPGAILAGGALAARSARAAMPAALAAATARAAVCLATGQATAGAVPAVVASLGARFLRRRLMTKICLATAVFLAFGAIGSSGPSENESVVVKYTFVDLQPKGNHRLIDHLGTLEGNNLAEVPRGRVRLGCTPFKIGERLIRVRGARSPEPPEAVTGIAIDARFDSLHILQSTMFGNAFGLDDGTEIGTYTIHYADRTEERIPIIYGRDVRDWWRDSDPSEPSQGKVAWSGKNRAAVESGGQDSQIRLFTTEWKNPHPDRRVATIDIETKDTPCAPFLVALTLEQSL
jgi:RNA polymerase sigma factor (sigma-70 family)